MSILILIVFLLLSVCCGGSSDTNNDTQVSTPPEVEISKTITHTTTDNVVFELTEVEATSFEFYSSNLSGTYGGNWNENGDTGGLVPFTISYSDNNISTNLNNGASGNFTFSLNGINLYFEEFKVDDFDSSVERQLNTYQFSSNQFSTFTGNYIRTNDGSSPSQASDVTGTIEGSKQ